MKQILKWFAITGTEKVESTRMNRKLISGSRMQKPTRECFLADLQGEQYTFLQTDTDLEIIADDYAGGARITGAVVKAADGEYEEVWVTESSRPFELNSRYIQKKNG